MFTNITRDAWTRIKQPKKKQKNCTLGTNLDQKGLWQAQLKSLVLQICKYTNIPGDWQKVCWIALYVYGFCPFNKSDQIIFGIVCFCFGLKNWKNVVVHYSRTFKQYFCDDATRKWYK